MTARQWPCPHCGQRVDLLEDGLDHHYYPARKVCPWSGWMPPEQPDESRPYQQPEEGR